MPSWLPRVGVQWILDKSLNNVQWYGEDRRKIIPTGNRLQDRRIQIDSSEMYEPYLIPQDYGLRSDNRWVRMTDADGTGLNSAVISYLISVHILIQLKTLQKHYILISFIRLMV